MGRGVDVLRIGGTLLAVGVTIVTVPATLSLAAQHHLTPSWFQVPVSTLVHLGILLAAGGAVGLGTTRLAARLHVGTVLVAVLVLPAVTTTAYAPDSPPWVHAYLPSAVAATLLVSRSWTLNLVLGAALLLADLRLGVTTWPVPAVDLVNDLLFEATVLAMGAAVIASVALSQRQLEEEAAVTAERFLQARAAERLGRRSAHWDALVHDDILAALETIALDPPEVDVRALARSTIEGLADGPPAGDVDHVSFRQAVLDAVLAELPTASTRCVAARGARHLPPDVAEALLMALTEALRNAATHAYDRAGGEVSVRLGHGTERVEVLVADRGRGFDRARVGPTSFGLALSIEGRLGAVGGLATVRSQPGQGTTVTLLWPAGALR